MQLFCFTLRVNEGTIQTSVTTGLFQFMAPFLFTIQPLLSAALLDHLIHHDRNIPPEYTSPENYNEIQVAALFKKCEILFLLYMTSMHLINYSVFSPVITDSHISFDCMSCDCSCAGLVHRPQYNKVIITFLFYFIIHYPSSKNIFVFISLSRSCGCLLYSKSYLLICFDFLDF